MTEIYKNHNLLNNTQLRSDKASFKAQDSGVKNQASTKLPESKPDSFEKKTDKTVKTDASNDGKFSLKEAGKNLLKGAFIKPFEHMFSSPANFIKSVAIGAVMGYVTLHCLPLAGLAIAAGAFGGGLGLIMGAGNVISNKLAGKNDEAEKAFTDIGQSLFTLASTAFYARGLAKSTNSTPITQKTNLNPLKFNRQGITTWFKETGNAIKAEGFDSMASAWHVGWASIKGGLGAFNQTFIKHQGSFLENYSTLRSTALTQIHNKGMVNPNYDISKARNIFNKQKEAFRQDNSEPARIDFGKMNAEQRKSILQNLDSDNPQIPLKGPLHRLRLKLARSEKSGGTGLLSKFRDFISGENKDINGKQRYFAEVIERRIKSENYLTQSDKLLTDFHSAKNVFGFATLDNIAKKEASQEASKQATQNITGHMAQSQVQNIANSSQYDKLAQKADELSK